MHASGIYMQSPQFFVHGGHKLHSDNLDLCLATRGPPDSAVPINMLAFPYFEASSTAYEQRCARGTVAPASAADIRRDITPQSIAANFTPSEQQPNALASSVSGQKSTTARKPGSQQLGSQQPFGVINSDAAKAFMARCQPVMVPTPGVTGLTGPPTATSAQVSQGSFRHEVLHACVRTAS